MNEISPNKGKCCICRKEIERSVQDDASYEVFAMAGALIMEVCEECTDRAEREFEAKSKDEA